MGQEGAWRSFDGTHQEDAFRYAEDVGQTSLVCTGQLESLLIYSILVSTLLMYVMRVRNTVYSLFSLNYYLVVITKPPLFFIILKSDNLFGWCCFVQYSTLLQ